MEVSRPPMQVPPGSHKPVMNTGAPTTSQPAHAMPDWDNAEIEKKLKENAEALKEWTSLLDKADATARSEDIPQADIQQHISLKRKLHENLGVMAKMVQAQIKKRPLPEGVNSNPIPSNGAVKQN